MVLGGSGLRALAVLGGAGVWGSHPVGRDMLVQLEAGVPWVRGQCRRATGSSVPLILLFLDPRLRPQLQGIDPRVRGPPALDGRTFGRGWEVTVAGDGVHLLGSRRGASGPDPLVLWTHRCLASYCPTV